MRFRRWAILRRRRSLPDRSVGILGIDFSTRRRNRANGRIVSRDANGYPVLPIDQSFGNCPQYIQLRTLEK